MPAKGEETIRQILGAQFNDCQIERDRKRSQQGSEMSASTMKRFVGRRWAVALVALAAVGAVDSDAATPVGEVSRLKGMSTGVSEGTSRQLEAGAAVHLQEEVSTGVSARLEITFDDGTTLTLGEQARLVIDTYVYKPAGSSSQILVSAAGPFRFVTGAIGQLAGTVSVQTPVALIGVRGTDFWGGPLDGRYGVFLLEGEIAVTNNAGQAVLDQSGQGVDLDGPDIPPPPVTIWPEDKVARAIATVTFN